MKTVLKRVSSVLVSLLLILCMVPVTPSYAVIGGIAYIDENGETQVCTSYHLLTAPMWNYKLSGWQVVNGDVTIEGRQEIDGTAHTRSFPRRKAEAMMKYRPIRL